MIRSGIKLKLGTINDPGSGYVLFYTGILMCLFALTIIVSAVTEGGPSFGSRWEGARWTKPLASSPASPHFPSRWSRSASCSRRSR